MKRDILLSLFVSLLALSVGGVILWWIGQRSRELPADLKVVKLSEEVMPFYENVFADAPLNSQEILLSDPILGIRGKPFLSTFKGIGPHDSLGFRNEATPRVADLVTIGDSQTYGNNVLLSDSWPKVVESSLRERGLRVYDMSTGGWSIPQYLYTLRKSL